MTNIYIESKHKKTVEAVFLQTLLEKMFAEQWSDKFQIIPVDGWTNLINTKPIIESNTLGGGHNLVIFDADISPCGGFDNRHEALTNIKTELNLEFDIFLFPNNEDDGTAETLIERIAQRELHIGFFNCYERYEQCVSGHTSADGAQKYLTPNLKGKLHTYISAMPMSKNKRSKLGSGNWMFEDPEYWDINSPALNSLKHTLRYYATL